MSKSAQKSLSLSEFKRDSSAVIADLQAQHGALTLTIHGKPAVVVQDVAVYERQLADLESSQTIEGIRRGLESMREERGLPTDAAFAQLEAKYPFLGKR